MGLFVVVFFFFRGLTDKDVESACVKIAASRAPAIELERWLEENDVFFYGEEVSSEAKAGHSIYFQVHVRRVTLLSHRIGYGEFRFAKDGTLVHYGVEFTNYGM